MMDVHKQKQNQENGGWWIWKQTSLLDVSLWQTGETVVVENRIYFAWFRSTFVIQGFVAIVATRYNISKECCYIPSHGTWTPKILLC